MLSSEFWSRLESFGEAIAVEEGERRVSYTQLASLCDAFAATLPASPQLVAIQACNQIEAVVAYLGCLRAGHPVILLNKESLQDGRIVSTFQPDWLFNFHEGAWHLDPLNGGQHLDYADGLAVMLSTSGTTGAPKLVRLSRENINANAGAIAQYLELSASDCAITTLNFFYSYGMAVLNSHLTVGARIVLTDASVVTPEFWQLFKASGSTSLAFVPYHFELLERTDFLKQALPSLRYITQAGGRLHRDTLKRFAEQAREHSWKLFVMYGQTEAAPRMSYVPPEEILDNLGTIGRAVPGGELSIIDENGAEITRPGIPGELVYRGPNVMLGYAETREDLSRPRDTFALRTGDVAERRPNGYFEIVGRLKRFIKLYGLRLNLDDLEIQLSAAGFDTYCVGTDEVLAVFHEKEMSEKDLLDKIVETWGIQRPNIMVRKLDEVPLLPSGKVNYAKLGSLIDSIKDNPADTVETVSSAFAEAFGRDVSPDDTFIALEGDSLLFLHLSLSLERILGFVPIDWERKSIRELEGLTRTLTGSAAVPIDAIARCVAIMGVLTNHLGTLGNHEIAGGALALLFLSGVSVVRIHGERLAAGQTFKFLKAALFRILAVYYVLISLLFLVTPQEFVGQEISWFLLYGNWNMRWDSLYTFWFVCAYAQVMFLFALFWSIPSARNVFKTRMEAFGYFALAVGLACAVWASYAIPDTFFFMNPMAILYVFALGWCAYFADQPQKKLVLSATLLISTFVFWQERELQSNAFLSAIVLVSIWIPQIKLPRILAKIAVRVASASFYIYILHIFPVKLMEHFELSMSLGRAMHWVLGVSICLTMGVLAERLVPKIEGLLKSGLRKIRSGAPTAAT